MTEEKKRDKIDFVSARAKRAARKEFFFQKGGGRYATLFLRARPCGKLLRHGQAAQQLPVRLFLWPQLPVAWIRHLRDAPSALRPALDEGRTLSLSGRGVRGPLYVPHDARGAAMVPHDRGQPPRRAILDAAGGRHGRRGAGAGRHSRTERRLPLPLYRPRLCGVSGSLRSLQLSARRGSPLYAGRPLPSAGPSRQGHAGGGRKDLPLYAQDPRPHSPPLRRARERGGSGRADLPFGQLYAPPFFA